MKENDLAYKVIGLAIEVHNVLGPGLLESAYQESLCIFNMHQVDLTENVRLYKDIK